MEINKQMKKEKNLSKKLRILIKNFDLEHF